MQQVVERAFATQPTDLIGVYGGATLTGKSMATMRDGERLDDNILNSYYYLIEERSKMSATRPSSGKTSISTRSCPTGSLGGLH